jgi:hypothetical protein
MFFELDDIKRRHMPQWFVHNVTAWTPSLDSSYTWNYQRGNIIKLIYRYHGWPIRRSYPTIS